MNERIKELADASRPVYSDGKPVHGLYSEYHELWLEKFGESIVREVIYDCMHSVRGENVIRVSMVAKHWGVDV